MVLKKFGVKHNPNRRWELTYYGQLVLDRIRLKHKSFELDPELDPLEVGHVTEAEAASKGIGPGMPWTQEYSEQKKTRAFLSFIITHHFLVGLSEGESARDIYLSEIVGQKDAVVRLVVKAFDAMVNKGLIVEVDDPYLGLDFLRKEAEARPIDEESDKRLEESFRRRALEREQKDL